MTEQRPGLKRQHPIFSRIHVLALTAPLAKLSSHRSMGHVCRGPGRRWKAPPSKNGNQQAPSAARATALTETKPLAAAQLTTW